MHDYKPPQQINHQVNVSVKIDLADDVKRVLLSILGKVNIMAGELDRLVSDVQAQRTVVDSAISLIRGFDAKLEAAIASGNPQKLADLSAEVKAQTQALADAVADSDDVMPTDEPPPEAA